MAKGEKLGLDKAMEMLRKKHGATSIFKGSENISVQVETVSSGCLAFDYAVGCGIPLGRMIEIYGAPGSGKTAFSAFVISAFQKQGRRCVFIDGENTFTRTWAESLGVNWDDLIYARPDNLEQVLDMMELLASTGEIGLIVYDSIAALPSMQETEKLASDGPNVAATAKVLTPALRKLTPILARNKCTLICLNQVRDKIGMFSPHGTPEDTPGGRAVKFFSSLRLQLKRKGGTDIKVGERVVGHQVQVTCKKNKLTSAQGVSSVFTLMYSSGIDKVQDAIATAAHVGVVERPNNKTYIYGDLKVIGYDNFVEEIKTNATLLDKLIVDTHQKMKEVFGQTAIPESATVNLEEEEEDLLKDEASSFVEFD